MINLKRDKNVSQSDLAKYTGKHRQRISYLILKGKLDTATILGRTVIKNNRKLKNFIKNLTKESSNGKV